MTFTEAVTKFLEYLEEAKRSPATINTYRKSLNQFKKYLSSKYNFEIYLDSITPDDFESYLNTSLKGKASTTKHAAATAFKSLFSYCHKKGLCRENLGTRIENIKYVCRERETITEEELFIILEYIDNPVIRAIITTMYYTGLRVNECVSLTLDDVDFDRWIITVKKMKSQDDRIVPINSKLKPVLIEYYENRGNKYDTDQFFIGHRGTMSAGYVNRLLKEAVKVSGIGKNITTHVMRHSFTSNLVKNGIDLVRVKKLLGHRQIKTTSIYLHTSTHELKQEIDRL